MSDEDGDVILQRITITRRLRGEDGVETVSFDYEADMSWCSDLGLLEAAKFDLNGRMQEHWQE